MNWDTVSNVAAAPQKVGLWCGTIRGCRQAIKIQSGIGIVPSYDSGSVGTLGDYTVQLAGLGALSPHLPFVTVGGTSRNLLGADDAEYGRGLLFVASLPDSTFALIGR
jgi:hypothetical protein